MTRDEAITDLDQALKMRGYTRDDFTNEEIETSIQMIIDANESKAWYVKWFPTLVLIRIKIYFQKFCTWLLTLATKS